MTGRGWIVGFAGKMGRGSLAAAARRRHGRRMRQKSKVIITCAITGSIHTPSMSPYLPVTPEDIAAQAIEAAKAGAAILHLHARDPETGKPSPSPEIFGKFLPRIKEGCEAVVNITTGGGQGMTIDERIRAAEHFSPEMTSLNMGSMNFG